MTSAQLPNGTATSDVLVAHLQEIIVEYESYKKQFRRAESREPVSVPVEAMQLDAELRPCSDPFHMVTRDMSCGGVGMFHTEPVESQFLSLKFSSPVSLESFSVLARVGHCSPCGHYYIVGCTFITDPAELEG